ncbi:uncharacterized protein LOC128861931 [Anastrepha ludens]|uniref:uncharacterized protein LOC128861931 n=1 Tax=Anastrepha ludens TaxID=28586 RepID=UPI0023B1DBFA|nr:uncharacterized protein LOC128861931 [Anastrepha ludens]
MEFAKCIVLLTFCGLLSLTGIRADLTVGACLSYYAGIAYGDCIPIQDCPTLYEIALKPTLLVEDVNLLRNSKCGSANNKFYVCCPTVSWLRQSQVSISVPESICQAPNGASGVCKPIKGCSALMNIAMKEKIAPEEIIYLRNSLCGNANGNFMACCPVAPNISEDEVESTTVATAVPKPEACQTPNGEPGECTSIRDCRLLVNLVTNPDRTEAETALLRKSQCGLANGTFLACCPLRKSVKIRAFVGTTTERIFSTQSSSKGTERALRSFQFPEEAVPETENYRDTTESTRTPSKQNKCGRAVLSNRIFNGNQTEIDEFPWTALLVYTNDYDDVDFLCGGALISKNYVLTAAHCADGYSIAQNFLLTSVRLGEWNTRTERDCQYDNSGQAFCAPPHRDVEVQRITIHPHYNHVTLTNDIALLRLAEYVDLTDFINVICLPLEASQQSELYEGAAAEVAGWGATETSPHSSVKLKTTITVLNSTQCGVKKSRRGITISDKQICATGSRADSCHGDSGGPLMLTESQNGKISYYLIGVVSFGTGECGQKDTRGIYTRVGAYMDWIEDTMVIWSDETKINRFESDGCSWFWSKDPQQLTKSSVKETVKHGGGNIMVWGCITCTEFAPCQTPNGSAGSCKLIDACESIYKLATRDYLTEDEMHFLRQSQCGVANNKPIVCCPEDGEEHNQAEVEKSSASNSCQTSNAEDGDCLRMEDCQYWHEYLTARKEITEADILFLRRNRCGSDVYSRNICCPKHKPDKVIGELKVRAVVNDDFPIVPATQTCQTPDGRLGDCMALDNCNALSELSQKEDLTEDEVLFIRRSECETNEMEICCPRPRDNVDDKDKIKKVASFEPCVTSYVKKGECMPIRNCSILLNLVLKPDKTQANTIFLQSNQCGYVNNSPLVCCPTFEKPQMPTETSTTRTTSSTTTTTTTTLTPVTTSTTISPTTTTKSEVISGEICQTPNGTLGECKALENCDSLWNLHQMEHLTQEQLTLLDESECETSDADKVFVCCPNDIPKLEAAPKIAIPARTADPNECQTPNGIAGACISIIDCDSLMKIMNKSDFLNNDVNYLKASFCADADNFPKVCCPNDMSMPAKANLPMPPYCGRVVAENDTDVAARTTDIDEYPWTALLIYTNARGQLSFRCGGTLIHERYVLTGVHCLREESASSTLTGVRLGEWATQANVDCQSKEQHSEVCAPPHIGMGVEKLTMHPEYDSLNNDIALLRLVSAVQFTRFISPICLPFEISQQSRIVEGTTLHVAGWGATSNGEMRNLKMTSTVTVENLAECMRLFRTSGLVNLTAEHICAAGKSAAESVVHDSGGALMSMQEIGKVQSYFLVGIDTLSYEYALQQDFPGLYTRIDSYLEWIKNEIENN